MVRKIIKIDENKCNGCGLCAAACHEGAIGMVNGKAKLLREDYCDGLGDCLPACPTGAITFEEREAPAYDHAAVLAAKAARQTAGAPLPCGCPGSASRVIRREERPAASGEIPSELRQFPVQLKLVPVRAPYFDGADLLIAADCTAFAYGAFHRDFIRGRVVLVGCPKLDEGDYTEKLSAILAANEIRSVTVVRMEVPCCGGIQRAAEAAVAASGRRIPLKVSVIGIDGQLRSSYARSAPDRERTFLFSRHPNPEWERRIVCLSSGPHIRPGSRKAEFSPASPGLDGFGTFRLRRRVKPLYKFCKFLDIRL